VSAVGPSSKVWKLRAALGHELCSWCQSEDDLMGCSLILQRPILKYKNKVNLDLHGHGHSQRAVEKSPCQCLPCHGAATLLK
jgi:hypothetical protein